MSNRKLKEAGINPVLGYLLGLIVFFILSEYLFYKSAFAQYFVILICLTFLFRLSKRSRVDFLLLTFGNKSKNKLRVLENIIVCIPFVSVLAYNFLFIEAVILVVCSISIALFSYRSNLNFTIPTPFSSNPFEFSTGFRQTILVFPSAYALAAISIKVENLNLAIFSMILIFMITLSYYLKPEDKYYVWIHADTPKSFLKRKILMATKYTILLVSPITLGLLLFFPDEYGIIFLILLISILLLWTIILAKYAAFPTEINLPIGIIIALGVSFPPFLLLIIPYFYTKSIKNLRFILND